MCVLMGCPKGDLDVRAHGNVKRLPGLTQTFCRKTKNILWFNLDFRIFVFHSKDPVP